MDTMSPPDETPVNLLVPLVKVRTSFLSHTEYNPKTDMSLVYLHSIARSPPSPSTHRYDFSPNPFGQPTTRVTRGPFPRTRFPSVTNI